MVEPTGFKPPNNLFLLNPKHETFLTGCERKIHDGQFRELIMVILVIGVLGGISLPSVLSQSGNTSFDFTKIPAIIATAFILFILVLMLSIGIQHLIQNRKLERDGRLLSGRIVKVEGKRQRVGYRVEIAYQFVSLEGKELGSREDHARNDLDDHSLPAVGTPVAVLYVSPKLFRVL